MDIHQKENLMKHKSQDNLNDKSLGSHESASHDIHKSSDTTFRVSVEVCFNRDFAMDLAVVCWGCFCCGWVVAAAGPGCDELVDGTDLKTFTGTGWTGETGGMLVTGAAAAAGGTLSAGGGTPADFTV